MIVFSSVMIVWMVSLSCPLHVIIGLIKVVSDLISVDFCSHFEVVGCAFGARVLKPMHMAPRRDVAVLE